MIALLIVLFFIESVGSEEDFQNRKCRVLKSLSKDYLDCDDMSCEYIVQSFKFDRWWTHENFEAEENAKIYLKNQGAVIYSFEPVEDRVNKVEADIKDLKKFVSKL